jgi:hypothetical protein
VARFSAWLEKEGNCSKSLLCMMVLVIIVFGILPDVVMPMPVIPDSMAQPPWYAFTSNYIRLGMLVLAALMILAGIAAAIQHRIHLHKDAWRHKPYASARPTARQGLPPRAALQPVVADTEPFMVPAE